MQPVIDYISSYTAISQEEMIDFLSIMRKESVKKNQLIYRQGSVLKRAAFILKGSVRSFYIDENGVEHTVGFRFENQPILHFESFTQQTPVPLSAIALESTELVWVSHDDFFFILDKYPKYDKVLRNILGSSFSIQSEQMKLLRISSARERYEAFCEMRPEVLERVPLKYIASYLNMALETLSRVRAGKI